MTYAVKENSIDDEAKKGISATKDAICISCMTIIPCNEATKFDSDSNVQKREVMIYVILGIIK